MNLTECDIRLLHYLHAVKVSTYKQIHRDLYPEYQLRSVCNRLVKIERIGLIVGVQNRLYSCGERLISISKKGFEQFVKKGCEYRLELKSESVNHDLTLVDVRHRLLKMEKVKSYYSENEIQTWGIGEKSIESSKLMKLNSDAICNLNFSKGDIWTAIEYEDSEKSSDRYQPIVKKFYLSDEIGLVLYICKSQNLHNKISQIEQTLFPGDKPKIFYQTLDSLMQSETVYFSNFNNYQIQLSTNPTDERAVNS